MFALPQGRLAPRLQTRTRPAAQRYNVERLTCSAGIASRPNSRTDAGDQRIRYFPRRVVGHVSAGTALCAVRLSRRDRQTPAARRRECQGRERRDRKRRARSYRRGRQRYTPFMPPAG